MRYFPSLALLLPTVIGVGLFACDEAGSLTTLADEAGVSDAAASTDVKSTDSTTPESDADLGDNDAGEDGGVANAFTNAGKFQLMAGTSARNSKHAFGGATPTNPAKQPCLDCHKAGGSGPRFLFGGTAFKDVAGKTPAGSIEVRVRGPGGKAVLVHTDDDGNFFVKPGATDPATPWRTGARDATDTSLMVATVTDGNCNGCHAGGATAFIHVP